MEVLLSYKFEKKDIVIISIFAILLVIGISIYRDYGIHYDEKAQILIGSASYKYIMQGDQDLLNFSDRYYGPFFEVPLLFLSNQVPATEMIYLRHLAVFLTFFVGSIVFYFLARRLFNNSWWALLATILLVISPRIFADSFYNSKDIPFMIFFMIGAGALMKVLGMLCSRQSGIKLWGMAILHAFFCAVTIATRLPGIILVGLSIGLIVVATLIYHENLKRNTIILVCYLVCTVGLTVFFWPILWHDPIGEFNKSFLRMSRYPWSGSMLYQGEIIPARNTVWHYLPVWISISTPYLQLGAFVMGGICLIKVLLKRLSIQFKETLKSWRDSITPDSLDWMVVSGWLVIPFIAIYVFQSILYDAWRQMFFIYPAIVLIGVYGLKTCYEWLIRVFRKRTFGVILFGIIISLGILEPAVFMVQNHPFENVYFNALSGDPATLRQRYEMDYWGLSYKQGIDYILTHDSRDKIKIFTTIPIELYVEYMLPKSQGSRFVFVEPNDAEYFLSTYRWHPNDYPYSDKVFSIKVRGTEIMTVYRLNKAE